VTTRIVGPERSRGNIITEDLVRTLAHEAVGKGALDDLEAQLIDRIFDFGSKTVEDLMTPRSEIDFLPVELDVADAIRELRRTWQTRVPVYEGHRDRVLGLLHARDLLGVEPSAADGHGEGLRGLLRSAYFVPESKPAVDLFETFRDRRLSIALVVDEFGGVTGLVTMTDLLECIFGGSSTAPDPRHRARIEALGEERFAVDGAIRVAEFNRRAGADLPTEQAETLAGLLLHLHGELPDVGVTVRSAGFDFLVADVMDNRVQRVEFTRGAALPADARSPDTDAGPAAEPEPQPPQTPDPAGS